MFKKFIGVLSCILSIVLLLCGCSFTHSDTDGLLSPPRPAGELYKIQQVLKNSVSEKYTLKYPVNGEYRSAIIQKDLNSDGVDEAVAFYSTVKDNSVSMHILLIVKRNDEWISQGDFKCVATGVDSVEFKDMDADGNKEIIVGWSVFGNVEKRLGVYTVQNGTFMQRVNESYNNYLCEDLNGDGKQEIFLVNLNSSDATAVSKLIALTDDGTELLGSVPLDPNITGYSPPIVSKLPNGNTAIYVDAIKGSGVITEVLEIKNGSMVNALLNENQETADTFRASGVAARDIDADGVCEIPLTVLVTQAQDSNDNIYRTEWNVIKNAKLETKFSAFMNYSDGYYIKIPEKLKGKITVSRDTSKRIRTILWIDEKTGNSADILVRIQALPVTESSAPSGAAIPGATEIGRTNELYYLAACNEFAGEKSISLDEFKNYFKILGK